MIPEFKKKNKNKKKRKEINYSLHVPYLLKRNLTYFNLYLFMNNVTCHYTYLWC